MPTRALTALLALQQHAAALTGSSPRSRDRCATAPGLPPAQAARLRAACAARRAQRPVARCGAPARQRRRAAAVAAAVAYEAAPGSGGPLRPGELVAAPDAAVGYRVTALLGTGSSSHTYACTCERLADGDAPPGAQPGTAVALKAMSLRGMGGKWKPVELFEREARLLRSLSHPGIPALLDSFEIDSATDRVYVLVQQLAPGATLQSLVDSRAWRPDEPEIEAIALRLLDVLSYLHARRPPVVHRDLKPSNVLYDRASGMVTLVDFGAVRDGINADGSTMIGTFGFMPPEQFQGRASPASDMYSLGATLLLLLSGVAPSELPQRGLRLDWEEAVVVGPRLRALLTGLLQLEPQDRPDAAQAAAILRGTARAAAPLARAGARGVPAVPGAARRPAGTRVQLERDGAASLRITVPANGLSGGVLMQGTFAAAWLGIVGMWTASAVLGGAPLLFTAFSAPFWAVGANLAKDAVAPAVVTTALTLTPDTWSLAATARGGIALRTLTGETADLDCARVITAAEVNGVPVPCIELVEGVAAHRFGLGLQQNEAAWLQAEINAFLADAGAGGGAQLTQRREDAT